jgi:hypothetical protein
MRFEFSYTLDDLRELRRVHRKSGLGSSTARRRALIGWIVFIALAVLLIFVLRSEPLPARATRTVAPPPPPADLWSSYFPWFIAACVLIVWAFMYRRLLTKNPALHKVQTLEILPDALTLASGPTSSRWEWPAFDQFAETPASFFVHVNGSNNWVLLPKRAIVPPNSESEIRGIFETNIRASVGAFPVVPLPVDADPAATD